MAKQPRSSASVNSSKSRPSANWVTSIVVGQTRSRTTPQCCPTGKALVGEVLVEGDDQGMCSLRPLIHLAVTLAGQAHLDDVPDPPARMLLPQPLADRSRNVLIQ